LNGLVGIFWIFEKQIFFETEKLKDIKAVNSFKDSDLSHYQMWDKIKNQHPKFYLYEYEDIPRGRIIYNIEKNQFIVYCNENILKEKSLQKLILEKFQIFNENVIFKEDEHYRIF